MSVGRLMSIMLLLVCGHLQAQSVMDVPTASSVSSMPLGGSAMVGAPMASYLQNFTVLEQTGSFNGTADGVLKGLEFASSDNSFSPVINQMLALYTQLLSLDGKAASGIDLDRLRARISNDKGSTSPVDINELLAADFVNIEMLAVSQSDLRSLGIKGDVVGQLPVLSALTDKVKSAMLELPQSLADFSGAVALAVWDESSSQPELVSLVVRTD